MEVAMVQAFKSRLRSLAVPLCFLENGTTIVGYMEFEQNRALAESGFFFLLLLQMPGSDSRAGTSSCDVTLVRYCKRENPFIH